MALIPRLSSNAASAAANAVTSLVNGGYLDLYDGAQPATPDTAITTQVKLARLTFGTPAFGSAIDGFATANAISPDTSADAAGTVAWFRACTSAGAAVFDGTVGTSGCNLNLSSTVIVVSGQIHVTTLTYRQVK